MNRREFLAQLDAQLSRIAPNERADALAYYNEYFDEAGPENEARVIAELGSPIRVAAQIKADAAVKGLDETIAPPPVKKGMSTVWVVVLAILALPIALPVLIAILGVCVGLIASVFAVIVSLVAVVAAAFIGGVVVVVGGIAVMFAHIPTGLFYLGAGLVSIGMSLLLALLVFVLARALVKGIAGIMNWIRNRSKSGIRNKMKGGGAYE